MNTLTVYKALRQIVLKLTGVDECLLADQNTPAPSGTYATIRVAESIRPTSQGEVYRSYNKESRTITERIKYPVIYSATVNFYRGDAQRNASQLINCSRLSTIHDILLRNGLGWVDTDPVQNLTALQSNEQEQRAVIVIRLVGTQIISETVNTIEAIPSITVEDERKDVLVHETTES